MPDFVGHLNDESRYVVSKPRVRHALADGKGTGYGYEHVPRHVLAVLACVEHPRPCHDDRGDTDKEEHVELESRHPGFHERQFPDGSPHNHEGKQDEGKPALASLEHLVVRVVT